MKKLVFTLFIAAFTASSLLAQDDGDKKVKLGIAITPALNWLAPSNDKKMSNDGSVIKMGIGLVADFRLTDIIWFHTGLEYTGAGGKLGYKGSDTAGYYYKDDAIQDVSPSTAQTVSSDPNNPSKGYKRYRLLTRNYKVGYIHIPLGFKLKTKELGGITYYGQIGGDLFIRTGAKGDDHVSYTDPVSGSVTESDMKGTKLPGSTVNLLNGAAHVGAGIEYRISGSTAITASIQYRHGIMNFTNSGTDYLLRSQVTSTSYTVTQFPNDTKLRQVVLTVGIMF
jgi:hypothetical protein